MLQLVQRSLSPEGIVALLEPFIDTIIICMITGLVLLSSGVWKGKNIRILFQTTDITFLNRLYNEHNEEDVERLFTHLSKSSLAHTAHTDQKIYR